MRRSFWLLAFLFSGASALFAATAPKDFEVTAPDGRRVLLKSDGTWQYVDTKDKAAVESKDKPKAAEAPKVEGELILALERRTDTDRGCRFNVRLANKMPYEVGNLVLHYAAYRRDVVYDTVSPGSGFISVKPGDTQGRQFEVAGVACRDISRVQVLGGDRCVMGDLHRWSDQTVHKGQCLARVRVAESELVRFDK